jgi:hypothetical protein
VPEQGDTPREAESELRGAVAVADVDAVKQAAPKPIARVPPESIAS